MTSRKAKITTTCKWTHNDTCKCICWILKQHKTLMTLPLKSTWKVWHLYKTNISYSIQLAQQGIQTFQTGLCSCFYSRLLKSVQFLCTNYSKLHVTQNWSLSNQRYGKIKHTLADIYLTVMFEVILPPTIDSKVYIKVFKAFVPKNSFML